jgi:hypothetical protein
MTGDIRPRRLGSLIIEASAGGWRTAASQLTVVEGTSRALFKENWTRLDDSTWQVFGNPQPRLDRGPSGIPGLNNNGDGSYLSGAYLRQTYLLSGGLGLEAEIYAPVTKGQWQQIILMFSSERRYVTGDWDHRSLEFPRDEQFSGEECVFGYPGGEGLLGLNRVSMTSRSKLKFVPVDGSVMTTSWQRVRIQIFGDGSCGIALDGKPIWRSPGGLPMGIPYRFMTSGASAGATMLVGPLEIWEGVRQDLDWSKVQK